VTLVFLYGCGGGDERKIQARASRAASSALTMEFLTIDIGGWGGGTVTVSPDIGLVCTTDTESSLSQICWGSAATGTVVTLTPSPDSRSAFQGWSLGPCRGTTASSCVVTISGYPEVEADFALGPTSPPAPASYALVIDIGGYGGGTVTATPDIGLQCFDPVDPRYSSVCSTNAAPGTVVTLTATPGAASSFQGWSAGPCQGTTASSCLVTINGYVEVEADFALTSPPAPASYALVVDIGGYGAGTVAAVPDIGLQCFDPVDPRYSSVCSANVARGTVVTLTATPGAASSSQGWSGACAGQGPACQITMSNAVEVVATFNPMFVLGGHITGLSGSGLVLGTTGEPNLAVNAGATSFAFAYRLAGGSRYDVTVVSQPATQTCAITSGSGTIGTGDVTNVNVTCLNDPTAWGGVRQFGSPAEDYNSAGVAVDRSGNVYVTGYTLGGIDGNVLTGSDDAFIAKFDAAGSKRWIRQYGAPGQVITPRGLAIDPSVAEGSLYMAAENSGLNPWPEKLDSAGNSQWSTPIVGPSGALDDLPMSVKADQNGFVYVAGWTEDFAGSWNAFVAEYAGSTGQPIWRREIGTQGAVAVANGVAVDPLGNVYVTGCTSGTIQSGASPPPAPYDDEVFVVKWNAQGDEQWRRQFASTGNGFGTGIAADTAGNIYVAGFIITMGRYDGPAVFKLDALGNLLWRVQYGTPSDNYSSSIAVYGNDAVYVAGSTYGSFDGRSRSGDPDPFVMKLDASGAKLWVTQLFTTDNNYAYGVAVDGSGNVYLSGDTRGAFPGYTVGGLTDIFLAKFDPTGQLQ
jgi:hypothetical protein